MHTPARARTAGLALLALPVHAQMKTIVACTVPADPAAGPAQAPGPVLAACPDRAATSGARS